MINPLSPLSALSAILILGLIGAPTTSALAAKTTGSPAATPMITYRMVYIPGRERVADLPIDNAEIPVEITDAPLVADKGETGRGWVIAAHQVRVVDAIVLNEGSTVDPANFRLAVFWQKRPSLIKARSR